MDDRKMTGKLDSLLYLCVIHLSVIHLSVTLCISVRNFR